MHRHYLSHVNMADIDIIYFIEISDVKEVREEMGRQKSFNFDNRAAIV